MNTMNLHEYEINHELLNEGEFESYEQQLASRLMSVSNEYEFENFLGGLIQSAKGFLSSPQGQAMKSTLVKGAKKFGRQALPSIAKNIGGYIGGSTGASIGDKAGSALSGMFFGSDVEALDYVRIIRKAAQYLNDAADGIEPDMDLNSTTPEQAVTQAINTAARPYWRRRRGGRGGAYRGTPSASANNHNRGTRQQRGRWIRRGRNIVLMGI